jgi:predicted AAA+ superfamily ATPase
VTGANFGQLAQEPALYGAVLFLRRWRAQRRRRLLLESDAVRANPGPLFEQWIGIELWKRLQYLGGGQAHYPRTKGGAEVDFIIALAGRIIPIEVKWTEHPTPAAARHLETFLRELAGRAPHDCLVCRCRAPLALSNRVTKWGRVRFCGDRSRLTEI